MLYDMTHYCVGITGSTKVFHICFVELSVHSAGLNSNGAPTRSSPLKVKLREFKQRLATCELLMSWCLATVGTWMAHPFPGTHRDPPMNHGLEWMQPNGREQGIAIKRLVNTRVF